MHDLSRPALDVALKLADDCGAVIEYVESELYGAVDALGTGRFDFVYTGVGALCWLPDIARWAEVVSADGHRRARFGPLEPVG